MLFLASCMLVLVALPSSYEGARALHPSSPFSPLGARKGEGRVILSSRLGAVRAFGSTEKRQKMQAFIFGVEPTSRGSRWEGVILDG